jgi:hypothetical protein
MLIFQEKRNTNYLFLTFIAVYAFAMAFFIHKVSKDEMTTPFGRSYLIAEAIHKK